MISLVLAPEEDEAVVLGETVSDLQTDLAVGDNAITGTLSYITGFTGFSGFAEEQSGNYMALKIATNLVGGTTTVELINGTLGHPVALDSDMNIILRITDPATQSIRVVTTKGELTETKEYGLADLVLTPAPDPAPGP